jgi:dienelactone hydrolase
MSKTLLNAAACLALAVGATGAEAATSKRVVFENGGDRLVGDLYLPEGYRGGQRLPAVVVTGAWMTVKEQMAGRYAAELANRGYAALAFDFRGWGQSEGKRRQLEDPTTKISDIKAAAAFLAKQPEVDPARLAALGICASAGYMVHAAADTPQVKSVALVAPWLHDREIVEQTYGGADGVAKLIAQGDAAEQEFRTTGRQQFKPAASTSNKDAVMFGAPYYTERDRGLIPEWRNEVDPSLWRGWLTFDAMPAAERLNKPFLMIHSEAAAIPQGAHRFFDRLSSSKDQLWLEKVTQFDFYDQNAPVSRAADAVAAHFRSTLG